jgi:putative ABC transport system permease protein
MVLAEALIYCLCGCLSGCIAGVALHRALSLFLFEHWTFPVLQVVLIFAACILTSVLSVIAPLKRIRSRGITEVISTL